MSGFLYSLRVEKAPYLVTILFASLGWGTKHTVDRILASPTIEYTYEVRDTSQNKSVTVTLRNVSHDKIFKNLLFVLLLPPDAPGEFLSVKKTALSPAWEGDNPPHKTKHSGTFDLPALHPNWEVRLVATFSGDISPTLRLHSSETSVRLVQPSVETFLVKHELLFFTSMIIIWALVILVLLSYRKNTLDLPEPDP